ncbi:MAG: hypothetical protein ABIJ97_16495 [Bacteroidota bacterium]
MKKNILVIITILLLSSFFGCKKYEELPCLSFRPPDRRIDGHWEIVEFKINGADSINSLSKIYGMDVLIISRILDSESGSIINFGGNQSVCSLTGEWNFSEDKTKLTIRFYSIGCLPVTQTDTIIYSLGPINFNIYKEWSIIKLSNLEFVINTEFESNDYYLRLKKNKS